MADFGAKLKGIMGGALKDAAKSVLDLAAINAGALIDKPREEEYQKLEKSYQQKALEDYKKLQFDQQLAKAMLIPRTGETASTIKFMFNPKDFNITHKVHLESMSGARTERGLPKINYGFVEPRNINIQGAIFDTYETGGSVLDSIKSILEAFDFSKFSDPFKINEGSRYQERKIEANTVNTTLSSAGKSLGGNAIGLAEYGAENLSEQSLELRRPPVYYFCWGEKNYMCCMIETANCKLMMFLPDGTPVRASVDITLREVDLGVASRKFSKRQKFVTA